METPKNQKQLVLWYLLNYESVTMKFVITDSLFFKFNTRLSEIRNEVGVITKKERVKFTNRFGRKSDYFKYSKSVTDERLKELFKYFN